MVAGVERENAMKVITDVSFYKLIQELSDGEDYIEDSGDLYGDHFNTVNGMIDYVVEYAFGDLYSDRYKTGITKMANDPRYSNCIDIRSGEDVEIGDDGMKHVEVDISSCSGDRIEMVPFSSELSKYTWSVSIAYSEDEVEGAENVHESRRPRGRMLKEDGRKRTVIFKQYRDISCVDIGFVDEEVALEAVKKLNDAMRFIKKNGGEIDGSFGLSDWD